MKYISGRALFYVFTFYFLFLCKWFFLKKNNKSNDAVPPVLLLYNDTPGVVLEKKQPYISISTRHNQLKTD